MKKGMKKWLKPAALCALLAVISLFVTSPALASGGSAYGLCVALGVVAGGAMLLGARCRQLQGGVQAALSAAPEGRLDLLDLLLAGICGALLGARGLYCLLRFSFYFLEQDPLSVLRFWEGGFLLYGAVLGAAAAVWLLARARGVRAAPALDELAAPALVVTAVARLGEWTVGEGLGTWVEQEALMRFPFSVMNDYGEWQLAVFLLEAAAAALLLLPVCRQHVGGGERFMTALLGYACCQVLLESLRMDASLRIGFVRVSQVLSGLAILAVTGVRVRGLGAGRAAGRIAMVFAGAAAVGALEWALDKTPVNNLLLYLLMGGVCLLFAWNGRIGRMD